MEKMLDGANIEYAPGRTMECHAVVDTANGWQPVNLLKYFDEQVAQTAAISLSQRATDVILARRNSPIPNSLPLPEIDKFPASRVLNFVSKLGMEPIGRFAFVESIPDHTVSGVTNYQTLTALVDKTNTTSEYDGDDELLKYGAMISNVFNAHGVAVHELTHLAGAQDVVYFFIDPTARHLTGVISQSSTLEPWPDIFYKKRSYFEEGLATLVQGMYFWRSTINRPNPGGDGFETYKSPSGQKLYLPARISNPATGHHEYINCAWGIERLVQLAPDVWDILMASRRYGARATPIRHMLQECIDYEVPGLFHHIDSVDVGDIDETIDVTARIDFAAARANR